MCKICSLTSIKYLCLINVNVQLVSHFDDNNLIWFLTATHACIGRGVQYILLKMDTINYSPSDILVGLKIV